jgi:hypothetical protein
MKKYYLAFVPPQADSCTTTILLSRIQNAEVSNLRDEAANWKQQMMNREIKADTIKNFIK